MQKNQQFKEYIKNKKKGTRSTYNNRNKKNFARRKKYFQVQSSPKKYNKIYYKELTDREGETEENMSIEWEKKKSLNEEKKYQNQNKRKKKPSLNI